MDLLIDFMARPVNFNFRSFCNIVLLSFLVNCSDTALQLEALVGDLEDGVFCVGGLHARNLFSEKRQTSLKSMVMALISVFLSFQNVCWICILIGKSNMDL